MVPLLRRYGNASNEYYSCAFNNITAGKKKPEVLRQAQNLLKKSILPVDELLSENKFLISDKALGLILC